MWPARSRLPRSGRLCWFAPGRRGQRTARFFKGLNFFKIFNFFFWNFCVSNRLSRATTFSFVSPPFASGSLKKCKCRIYRLHMILKILSTIGLCYVSLLVMIFCLICHHLISKKAPLISSPAFTKVSFFVKVYTGFCYWNDNYTKTIAQKHADNLQ